MLIAFAGYARCGKDTAFEIIKKMQEDGKIDFDVVKQISLAKHIKDVAFKVFGVTEEMKHTGAQEYYRMILTKLAEVMTIVSNKDAYLAEKLLDEVGLKNICSKNELYICTDARFKYDLVCFAERTSKEICFPIKITRSSMPPTKYGKENYDFNDYDFYAEVINDTSLESFRITIEDIVKGIINKVG